jgi:hypothetical protein
VKVPGEFKVCGDFYCWALALVFEEIKSHDPKLELRYPCKSWFFDKTVS